MITDYYKILEVDRRASPEVIKKAYRTLSMKFHPDKQSRSVSPEEAARMQQLNEAYDILSDPLRRQRYDESRLTWDVWLEHGFLGLLKNFMARSGR